MFLVTKSEQRKMIDIVYEIQETTFRSETKEFPEDSDY